MYLLDVMGVWTEHSQDMLLLLFAEALIINIFFFFYDILGL